MNWCGLCRHETLTLLFTVRALGNSEKNSNFAGLKFNSLVFNSFATTSIQQLYEKNRPIDIHHPTGGRAADMPRALGHNAACRDVLHEHVVVCAEPSSTC